MNLKENAKQPKMDGMNWRCPNCDNYVHEYDAQDLETNDAVRYCHMCGQKMDLGVIEKSCLIQFDELNDEKKVVYKYMTPNNCGDFYECIIPENMRFGEFLKSVLKEEKIETNAVFHVRGRCGSDDISTYRRHDGKWYLVDIRDVFKFRIGKNKVVIKVSVNKGYGTASFDVLVEKGEKIDG